MIGLVSLAIFILIIYTLQDVRNRPKPSKKRKVHMPQADIVSAALTAIQNGQLQVLTDSLNSVYVQAAQEQKASDGTLTQGDLDAAVKAATDPLNSQISDLTAKDAADIQAGTDALAALQIQFDQMSADKKVEDGVIAGLQAAKDQITAVLASLSAIGQPAPTPVPAPIPDPVPATT